MMDQKENKTAKTNYFVRILIVLLGILISSLIISNFYFFHPKGVISNGIIILIALLMILFLSEIFDSFSLGQFLSLKKTISEKNEKIAELKDSNDKLLGIVINNNSLSQKTTMTNVTGISPEEFAKTIISVIKADKETTDKEEISKEKIAEIAVEEEERGEQQIPRKRVNLFKLEEYVLSKFLDNKDLRKYNFIEDAQILMPQHGLDPVSDINPVFDGYVGADNYEMFIEIKLRNAPLVIFRDRLYVMLSKLFYYRQAKKTNAYLNLILVDRPLENGKSVLNHESKLIAEFEPAIRTGLLRIEYIQLSEEEMENGLYKD